MKEDEAQHAMSTYGSGPEHALPVSTKEAVQLLEAIHGAPDHAIIGLDPNERITSWNRGAQLIYGYGRADVIGERVTVLDGPNGNVERESVEETATRRFDTVRKRKDGTVLDVAVSVSPILDEFGVLKGWLEISHSIVLRKEAERALHELNRVLEARVLERSEALIASERRYHGTLDRMMEGVQLLDDEWRYVYVNDALVVQSTYTKQELVGSSMLEMYPGVEHTAMFAILKQCASDGKARLFENAFDFPDGSKGYFQLSIQPMEYGLFILSTDITERKRAETALRKAEARYHSALDVLMEGAQIIGLDWRHLYVNEALATQSMFSREELVGTTLMERYPGVERTEVFSTLQRCMVERTTDTIETTFTFPNGITKTLHMRIQPVDEGLFVLSQDISERKRSEEELAVQREKLLTQNRELEQFTYIASHDLQEPLRMITSYVQLLQRRYADKLDKDAHEFIAFAVDGAQRMKQLIEDLLAYSRIDQPISMGMVDLDDVARQALVNLGSTINEARAHVQVEVLPRIRASSTDMLQLFQNLIGNAVKFRREGVAPEIRIRAEEHSDHWHFRIMDNGIGIDPAFHDRVFMPFKRLNDRSIYSGSGIGLAIAEKIVKRHAGRIWFTPGPLAGTEFHFTLKKTLH